MKWFWIIVLVVPVVGAVIALFEKRKKRAFLAHDLSLENGDASEVNRDIERARDIFRPDR